MFLENLQIFLKNPPNVLREWFEHSRRIPQKFLKNLRRFSKNPPNIPQTHARFRGPGDPAQSEPIRMLGSFVRLSVTAPYAMNGRLNVERTIRPPGGGVAPRKIEEETSSKYSGS